MANDSLAKLKQIQAEARARLHEKAIAAVDEAQLSSFRKFVHFWVLVGNSFVRNRCPLRASALAYTTLLALIPLLAVGVGVSASLLKKEGQKPVEEFINKLVDEVAPQLGLLDDTRFEARKRFMELIENYAPAILGSSDRERTDWINKLVDELAPDLELSPTTSREKLETRRVVVGQIEQFVPALEKMSAEKRTEAVSRLLDALDKRLQLLPVAGSSDVEARSQVVGQIQKFIANIHSGTLGLTGTVALIFVAIGLLSTIEGTFNDIWGVPRGRSWFARVIHYWAAITLGPLIIILAMGLTIGSQFQTARAFIQATPLVGHVLFKITPFIILSGAFTLFYQLMPNTRVHWKAALVGGLVGGLLWYLNSRFNVLFASRVVTASKIYGSLGVVPVFLVGLYFSWLILLFGAQVAYAFQNRRAYFQEKQAESVHQRGREFIALRVMTYVGQRFYGGESPPGDLEIAEALAVPSRLVGQIIQPLLQTQLLVETSNPETGYAPGRPLDKISCHDILQALRAGQGQELATRVEPAQVLVRGEFEKIQQAERQKAATVMLETLVKAADGHKPMPEARME